MGKPGLSQVEGDEKDKVPIPIKLSDLGKRAERLAEQARPLRMVVIAGSFPYKKQIEEFKSKLGRSASEVLTELSQAPLKTGKQAQPSFRFLGVLVERREVDASGVPIAAKDPLATKARGEWITLNMHENYRPYIFLAGKRFEPDDPKFAPISFRGLVMPRIKQFRQEDVGTTVGLGGVVAGKDKERDKEDQYPKVEGELEGLKETLKALEGKKGKPVARPPESFNTDKFDPFGGTEQPAGDEDPGEKRGRQGAGEEGKITIPDHCLVRVVDVTVQPGRIYEYRLKVRMANPNYNRTDVASPDYRKGEELKTAEWSRPIRVQVQPELRYYAVDQKELERKYKGPYAKLKIKKDREVVLQVHRWLDNILSGGKDPLPLMVGEWAIAERMPVYRGEYAGRMERIELPVWRYTREKFVIATDSTTRKRRPGIQVYFGYERPDGEETPPEPILVDFEGGLAVQHDRPGKKSGITDTGALEVLLFTPDGNLELLEGARDVDDKDRGERLRTVRQRIKQVRSGKKESSGKVFGEP
jgi:hypothetical protein